MRHIFIINPVSGNGNNDYIADYIHQYFGDKSKYLILSTEYPGHATELAKQYSDQAYCIYAVGGDGTVHEVLNGCAENTTMAFIPVGSGNDYYSMIASEKSNELDVIKETVEGKNVLVDYAYANQERYLNCSNMGIDANINFAANHKALRSRFWMRFKKLNYLCSAVVELFKLKTFHATINIDGVVYEKDVLLNNVSLGKQYGGGFQSTPKASIQDGLLDICIVEYPRPVIRLVYLFPMFYLGHHEKYREVTLLTGKKVTITSDRQVRFGLDGEISECKEVYFEIVEKGLSLRVPQHSKLI